MARKKVSTTCYFTREQVRRLKALSAATRVPEAVYIREGLDMALEKHGAPRLTRRAKAEEQPPDATH